MNPSRLLYIGDLDAIGEPFDVRAAPFDGDATVVAIRGTPTGPHDWQRFADVVGPVDAQRAMYLNLDVGGGTASGMGLALQALRGRPLAALVHRALGVGCLLALSCDWIETAPVAALGGLVCPASPTLPGRLLSAVVRKLPVGVRDHLAAGGRYHGEQAHAAGLVDRLRERGDSGFVLTEER